MIQKHGKGDDRLARAIESLTAVLERANKLATLGDLQGAEKRLLQAIACIKTAPDELSESDQQLLDQLLSRTSKHAVKLEALDAMTK